MTAKNINGDIRWFMEDNDLDRSPDFKVKTSRKGSEFETVIYGVDAQRAVSALTEYLDSRPHARYEQRAYDGYLAVYQPAAA